MLNGNDLNELLTELLPPKEKKPRKKKTVPIYTAKPEGKQVYINQSSKRRK